MNNTNPVGGIGFFGVLFLIFLTLKLCGVTGWSWWWITAPLWGPPALGIVLIPIFLVFVALLAAISENSTRH